ncbi:hypothetical protein Tco_0414640 [Tanacetum coccineum]
MFRVDRTEDRVIMHGVQVQLVMEEHRTEWGMPIRVKLDRLSATTATGYLFLAGGQDNAFDEDVDEQPSSDLALNVDNVFQADDCDAFDSDVDEAPTAQTMSLSHANYSKREFLATFTSNRKSTDPEQYFGASRFVKMKAEAITQRAENHKTYHKALKVYPPISPANACPQKVYVTVPPSTVSKQLHDASGSQLRSYSRNIGSASKELTAEVKVVMEIMSLVESVNLQGGDGVVELLKGSPAPILYTISVENDEVLTNLYPIPNVAQDPVIPTGPSVSIAIDLDAPSGSHTSSPLDHHSSSVHHGLAGEPSADANPFAAADPEPFVNVFAPDYTMMLHHLGDNIHT